MNDWRTWTSHLKSLFHRPRIDRELEEELRDHIERETQQNIAAGMSFNQARRQAMLDFGGVEAIKEEIRDTGRFTLLESILQDTRFAWRMLRKNLAFTTVAVITVALGIGANTAIFNVVNAVLLQRLPYQHPERIVALQEVFAAGPNFVISPPNFQDYRQQQRTFDGLSMWMSQSVNITGRDRPDRMIGSFVSANFFDMLGVQPARGRLFLPGEDRPEAQRVAILGHAAWQARFGGDPNIIGQKIVLNGEPRTVVGILRPDFEFPLGASEVYLSILDYPNFRPDRSARSQLVIGRVKSGISLEAANADLNVIAQRLARDYPNENAGMHIQLTRVKDMQVEGIRPALLLLLAAVGVVLLIACANLANLLLARGAGRAREVAVRTALGASRMRIVRQLISESLMIAVIGGAFGLLIAWWGVGFLLKLNPVALPVDPSSSLEWPIVLFCLTLSLVTGVVFGLVPALQLSRPHLSGALGSGGRATSGARQHYLRATFVVCQIALSVVLLIAAGLLIRSFQSLLNVQPGFRTSNLLTMEYRLPKNIYTTPEKRWDFHSRMLREVQQVPGVKSAAIIQALPFSGNGGAINTWPAEHATPEKGKEPSALLNVVTPEYFGTVGLPALSGRLFTEHDNANTPAVAVVSKTLAEKFWPGVDPIGKELLSAADVSTGGGRKFGRATVIGIVPDTKHYDVRDASRPQLYLSYSQYPGIFGTLVVHTEGEPMELRDPVRQAVWRIDKDQPVWKIRTLETLIKNDVAPDRFVMVLMSLFGGLALILTAIGTYGVISFGVAQRTQEIGVRMALGATPRSILSLVLNGGVSLMALGGFIGVAAALLAGRAIRTLLFNVSPVDPATFACVLGALTLIALLATYLPARRATRVDPMVALRYE